MRVSFQENENKFETLLVKPYTNQVALNIFYACRSHRIIVLNDVCPNQMCCVGCIFELDMKNSREYKKKFIIPKSESIILKELK